ncbi:PP2C family protein-serine/threonine phosphatase [Urbifossiella limnaea]|uniref:Phosphoserine phosphatase RsbU n=1 Tax=Urbifossiella limnaea TaxID=2528023 RepID=A0A517XUN4_9BACT|nr:PP2C family protein-serine/threonine phosphatase [Urbifossiella limnaea]QDU21218.1 Phosphoserine phosphatase RsbU [Urbifossiella limnaea]
MSATSNPFDTESRNWRGRLAASVELMRALSRSSDPQEMYGLFSRRMDELFPVTRRLSLSRRGLRPPEYRVTRCSLWKDAANPWTEPERLPVHRGGVLAELLYADEPRLIPDLRLLDDDDPAVVYLAGQRSVLVIPHFEQGLAVNAIVLAREEPDAFSRDQLPDLVMLSNLFGRATQTLVLSQAVKGAFDAADFEMKAVADIQKALLPDAVPRVPGIDVAVDYRAAARAGGDYYDFFPLPGGKLGVLIADASGHGAPAAVLMAMTHSIAHTLPEADRARPHGLLTQLNAHLARRYTRPTGSFVTAFAAVFDPANHSLTYSSAGHAPPLVARADGTRATLNRAQKLPLGIKPTETYTEQTATFQPGDRVVLVTDGILEAANAAGDMFGTAGVGAALRPVCDAATDDLAALLATWAAHTAGVPTTDDRTVVVVRATGGEP